MKKLISFLLALACTPLALAAGSEKEQDRVKDAGVVLKEILNIPDDIPKDLIDDAECVMPHRRTLHRAVGRSRHVRA